MSAIDLSVEANKESIRLSTLLLGVAASAIAFAIHETADRLPTWSLIPVALAGILWAGSFSAGVLYAHSTQAAMKVNAALNEMSPEHPRFAEAEGLHRGHGKATAKRYQVQLWTLLAGAIFYTVGHAAHIVVDNSAKRATISEPQASKSQLSKKLPS